MNSENLRPLSDEQIQRYSRQILLKEIGTKGTQKLLQSRVVIIGAGGLGCPAVQMLAAAGIGHIRIVDGDIVDLSNLPRQILHYSKDIGIFKVQSIKQKINAMNQDVDVEIVQEYVTPQNITGILKNTDYVIEATDNFGTKFLVNDACIHLKIPFTIAGVVQFHGQILSVLPGETTCYRCLFKSPLSFNPSETCSEVGVLNTIPNFAGILQATEAIKSILNLPVNFRNRIFVFDLFAGSFDYVDLYRNSECEACAKPEKPFYQTTKYWDDIQDCQVDLKDI